MHAVLGRIEPLELLFLRDAEAEQASEPRTAAAAACVSKELDESSAMSGKCHPERRYVTASDASTRQYEPRAGGHGSPRRRAQCGSPHEPQEGRYHEELQLRPGDAERELLLC